MGETDEICISILITISDIVILITILYSMGKRWGNSGNSVRFYFWGAPKSLQMVTAVMKLKDASSSEGKL